MTDGAALLRMLEPAVRPVGAGSAGPAGGAPVEHRSFEELLSAYESGELDSEGEVSARGGAASEVPGGLLGLLSGVDSIENGSLLRVMEHRGGMIEAAESRGQADDEQGSM